jgi:arylformamidase
MKIYDITLTIHPSMPVWPGDPPVQLGRVSKIEDGANANVSRLALSAHTGTHVDAPYHFLGDSPVTVDLLSLDVLNGEAVVLHLSDEVGLITRDVLVKAGIPQGTRRLLLRTRNSQIWTQGLQEFQTGFVGIGVDGSRYLVERGIELIGVDYLSVAPYKQSRPTHEVLLRAGMIIVEGLDLSQVPAGIYSLHCLPLKLGGSDGAPARAILVANS